jgi:hypothetical protein
MIGSAIRAEHRVWPSTTLCTAATHPPQRQLRRFGQCPDRTLIGPNGAEVALARRPFGPCLLPPGAPCVGAAVSKFNRLRGERIRQQLNRRPSRPARRRPNPLSPREKHWPMHPTAFCHAHRLLGWPDCSLNILCCTGDYDDSGQRLIRDLSPDW